MGAALKVLMTVIYSFRGGWIHYKSLVGIQKNGSKEGTALKVLMAALYSFRGGWIHYKSLVGIQKNGSKVGTALKVLIWLHYIPSEADGYIINPL